MTPPLPQNPGALPWGCRLGGAHGSEAGMACVCVCMACKCRVCMWCVCVHVAYMFGACATTRQKSWCCEASCGLGGGRCQWVGCPCQCVWSPGPFILWPASLRVPLSQPKAAPWETPGRDQDPWAWRQCPFKLEADRKPGPRTPQGVRTELAAGAGLGSLPAHGLPLQQPAGGERALDVWIEVAASRKSGSCGRGAGLF